MCLELPSGRIEQCANGHIFCAEERDDSCLAKLRRFARAQHTTPKCCCNFPLPPVLNRCLIAEQSIALLPVTCRYCGAGLDTF
jgi:hypothetical protein